MAATSRVPPSTGLVYREIKQSLTDLEKMFNLMEKEREVADLPGAAPLRTGHREGAAKRGYPVNQPLQAAAPRRVGPTTAVVADLHDQQAV